MKNIPRWRKGRRYDPSHPCHSPPRDRGDTFIVARESGLAPERCAALVRLASSLRELKGQDLEEGVSTRLLVYCATLIATGVKPDLAVRTALIEPLTDDPDVKAGLMEVVRAAYG